MKTQLYYLKEKRMIKMVILTILIILWIDMIVLAQSGEIRGTIYADNYSETTVGANIWVEIGTHKIGAASGIDGRFVLKPLAPGKYNVNISFVGFQKQLITEIIVNPEKTTDLGKIILQSDAKVMKGLEITAWKKKLIDAEDPSKMPVLAEDIKNLPDNKNLKNIIASVSSDIKVSEDGDVYMRGSRSGDEAYYVDGILVKNLDHAVPGTSISSITVYTGGVPSQYGDLTGGVIVINTKSYFELYHEWLAINKYKNNH